LGKNALLKEENIPINWKIDLELADNEAFMTHQPLEKLHL
jgi:hypothetical protein